MSNGVSKPRPAGTPEDRRALVAIDLGAESCRVSLLRWTSNGPHIQLVHRFTNDAVETADGLRWNRQHIWAGLQQGLTKCAEIATEGVRSIGVDGWAVDYVRLDDNRAAVADPFCYRDERTIPVEPVLHGRISAERLRDITGVQLMRINTAYQLFSDTPSMQKLRWLNLPEYILYRLGGMPVAELTNASHTQLLGLDGQWSSEIFSALNMNLSTAPQVVPPGSDLGQLSGTLSSLPEFANTRLIAPACHDTASAIAAVPDVEDDWAYISSGTWSLVGTVLNEPVNSAEAREHNFTNLRGVDGTICFHKNVNGMWLLRQCMDEWNKAEWNKAEWNKAEWSKQGAPIKIEELVEAAALVPAPAYLLDVDDPDLLMPGHMIERINAQLARRGLAAIPAEREAAPAVASFLFHSLAARYAEVLRNVAEIADKPLRRIYIMGGGSQNELLNRLTAEATGLEVVRIGTECSTQGNFAVQLATLEQTVTPNARPTAVWAAKLSPHARRLAHKTEEEAALA